MSLVHNCAIKMSSRVKSGNGITLSLSEETQVRTNFWALFKHQSEKPKKEELNKACSNIKSAPVPGDLIT